jgi:hypothetical protein
MLHIARDRNALQSPSRALSTKFQAPSTKHQGSFKLQASNINAAENGET